MADIKENTVTVPPPRQGSFVGTTLFWIVTAVLVVAIGAVFFFQDKAVQQARDDFDKTVKATSEKLSKDSDDKITAAKSALMQEVANLQQENKKLAADKDALAKSLATLTDTTTKFIDSEYKAFKTKSEAQIAESKSDISKTSQSVQKVEVNVKYLTQSVNEMKGKLDGLSKDIAGLSTGSVELKQEQAALKAEIMTAASSGKVTHEQLATLESKTREFELKIMAEHAKQAVKALKAADGKSWLEQLEIKGN